MKCTLLRLLTNPVRTTQLPSIWSSGSRPGLPTPRRSNSAHQPLSQPSAAAPAVGPSL